MIDGKSVPVNEHNLLPRVAGTLRRTDQGYKASQLAGQIQILGYLGKWAAALRVNILPAIAPDRAKFGAEDELPSLSA
jgi:hypothetical protein